MRTLLRIGTFFGLSILIVVRILVPNNSFMVSIQYLGLGIALLDLAVNILYSVRENKSFGKILVITLILMVVYILIAIVGCLHLVEMLSESKAMDVITLLTLLASLPQDLYIMLLTEGGKGKNERENN